MATKDGISMAEEMVTYRVSIEFHNDASTAQHYGPDWRMLRIERAVVVKNGTQGGKPSVDLQLVDADGNKYVVMATGSILASLGAAAIGAGAGL